MLQSGEAIQFSALFSVTFTDQHILPREFLEVLSGVNVHPTATHHPVNRVKTLKGLQPALLM